MKTKTIHEQNQMIAEFMGAKPSGHGDYELYGILDHIQDGPYQKHFYTPEEMLFHQSWDWLMPVVDKCTQIGFRDTDYDNEIYQKWEDIFDNQGMFLGNHINEVHDAVVQFIEWYKHTNNKN